MKSRRALLFLLPSLIGVMIFYVVPFFASFSYAFTDSAISGNFVGFKNFIDLLGNEYFRLAMVNTFRFTALSVPAIMVISTLLALLTAAYARKLPIVKSALFLPVILPSATVIMLWNAYMSDIPPFTSLLAIYLWKYGGLTMMLILTALSSLPGDMLDASVIDGASPLRQVISVTLPNITPTLFFALIISIVNSLKIFRESYLLYGGYPDEEVYMLQNYLNNHFDKLNYQNIATAAIFFAVIVYTFVTVIFAAEKKWGDKIW